MSSATAPEALRTRVQQHLDLLYPGHADSLADELLDIMGLPIAGVQPRAFANLWDEQDVFAITYANSIVASGETPLSTLHDFLSEKLLGFAIRYSCTTVFSL